MMRFLILGLGVAIIDCRPTTSRLRIARSAPRMRRIWLYFFNEDEAKSSTEDFFREGRINYNPTNPFRKLNWGFNRRKVRRASLLIAD